MASAAQRALEIGAARNELLGVGGRGRFIDGGLLTVSEVAGVMRVSKMTIYRLIKGGQLPATRAGKNYRIRETDLNDYLAARSVTVEA